MTSNCTCELLASGAPANSTACAEMLGSCGGSSVPMSVSVGVALLLLLAFCGLGGFWCWRHRDASQLPLPTCLRRSGRGRDYPQTLSLRPHAFGPKCKAPGGAQGRRPAAGEADPGDHYENLEVGPPRAEEADQGLYENTRLAGSAEHVCGNEVSPYYNFQRPVSPETAQDEDIYILPD
ncbi:protein GAPT [Sturnira hondurensis]|uniref:protein GAPT n=1 Tax=Sturnira hondurensis TaxID=192404 RepID=UPI00187AA999|nr:protein GAPT [Sturnira hondurensis]XP_036894425.1 protein GAPT [Sturnira hondurensis]XP_036894426.1 protein GAPT [Sturnira hondurensis]